MLFTKENLKKILAGTKTETRRLVTSENKRPARPGAIHKLRASRYTAESQGEIRVLSVDIESIGKITDEGARREGYESTLEFWKDFARINKLDDALSIENLAFPVWVVKFELV